MGGKFEIGYIRGIPLVVDGSFLILAVLWSMPWLRTGDIGYVCYGLLLVAGLAGSIILHELGHAIAGQRYGVRTSHMELNGLGGLCFYASAVPVAPLPRIVMLLAGPAANLVLWITLGACSHFIGAFEEPAWLPVTGFDRLGDLLESLAQANFWMLCFNLLPAYPLDGGKALEALIRIPSHVDFARYIVGWLGLLIALGCALSMLSQGVFMLVLAHQLFASNAFVLSASGKPPWSRWT